ncbi:efflux RND transporter periplasmic adaptor subunit [Mangrovivirga sp. M17]|uniref:Efflux RND transporter periplasmic adaptor subunit n=1 Tax=Mangrovivirga halotolerans TaxID=2993936 RepID=A0ABT3RQX6_9BACT|nr:efflux RND transporter periplasmic adaptor subunit [Mangrovivirga halotolerans]MCX2744169.1 efflux RND transporter periplasmic adaptor subunit [Mangrovivirga halotolerans]
MTKKKTILISIVILVAAVVTTVVIFLTEPEAEKEGATKKTAMLVNVEDVERGDFNPVVVATGTVQGSKDIIISPEVRGLIVSMSDKFTPGTFVRKGELLVQIDPADFENNLMLRKSDLKLAKANLAIEKGRQDVAEKDYELIGEDMSPENKSLVLREPQLEIAKANVAAAEAAVKQAREDLISTSIKAPFDAQIIDRNANKGSMVSPGDNLGRLVGVEEYWIVANIPVNKVRYLRFPGDDDQAASTVEIKSSSGGVINRKGKLYKLIGALNNETRLARVLITVDDPLGYEAGKPVEDPLLIGSFVEVQIQANEIKDVVRLNRDYLRKENTVWVMEDGELKIKEAEVILQDSKYAYISNGLEDGDKVVTTNISTVVEGSKLRVKEEAGKDTSVTELK